MLVHNLVAVENNLFRVINSEHMLTIIDGLRFNIFERKEMNINEHKSVLISFNIIERKEININQFWAVAQLVKRSLPKPLDPGSNPDINISLSCIQLLLFVPA